MDNLFDNEPTFFKFIVRIRIYYTIDDFRWGEYKDWSTHGTWYSPRHRMILYNTFYMFLSPLK